MFSAVGTQIHKISIPVTATTVLHNTDCSIKWSTSGLVVVANKHRVGLDIKVSFGGVRSSICNVICDASPAARSHGMNCKRRTTVNRGVCKVVNRGSRLLSQSHLESTYILRVGHTILGPEASDNARCSLPTRHRVGLRFTCGNANRRAISSPTQ